MGITIASSPDSPATGDHVKFKFVIKGNKLADARPNNETSTLSEAGEKVLDDCAYSISTSISSILGIEVKPDFEPNETQHDQIEGFVIELLKRLNSGIKGGISAYFDTTRWIVIVNLTDKQAETLTWQEIKDAIK